MSLNRNLNTPDLFSGIQGIVKEDYPIGKFTWFSTKGKSKYVFIPSSEKDLLDFLSKKPKDLNVYIMGLGSNLLIRDGGFKGVVIKMPDLGVRVDGNYISASAGSPNSAVLREAIKNNLAGLEFFTSIPGSIGGLVAMNAGAYGKEAKDVLLNVRYINKNLQVQEATLEDLNMSYRKCGFIDNVLVFLSATFKCQEGSKEAIEKSVKELHNTKRDTQPTKAKTGGSTFVNTDSYKAWQLIDKSGLRGYKIGEAHVSTKHCNFLINEGTCAKDIEDLIIHIKDKVYRDSGVKLHQEIKVIGDT